jgi:hypothetical protein
MPDGLNECVLLVKEYLGQKDEVSLSPSDDSEPPVLPTAPTSPEKQPAAPPVADLQHQAFKGGGGFMSSRTSLRDDPRVSAVRGEVDEVQEATEVVGTDETKMDDVEEAVTVVVTDDEKADFSSEPKKYAGDDQPPLVPTAGGVASPEGSDDDLADDEA